MNSYAYVTLIMKNDKYVAGALVLAHSLRESGTIYPLICMITSDISDGAVAILKKSYDYVWTVPYITQRCIQLKTRRQRDLYENWIEDSFTKWNCLNHKMFGMFDKVLFIDADMMVVENCDRELFSLEPPAMTFSLPWAKPYTYRGLNNPYNELDHGSHVETGLVINGLKSFVGMGSLVLVRK